MCDSELILYEETGVFYGFNGYIVLYVWIGVLAIALGITGFRYYKHT